MFDKSVSRKGLFNVQIVRNVQSYLTSSHCARPKRYCVPKEGRVPLSHSTKTYSLKYIMYMLSHSISLQKISPLGHEDKVAPVWRQFMYYLDTNHNKLLFLFDGHTSTQFNTGHRHLNHVYERNRTTVINV